jgi:hypothetical protein
MLGIVHHSPVIISVIIDRALFKKQLITEDDANGDAWVQKVDDFKTSPSGKRSRVLFIEKVDSLQKMLAHGFDPSPFKVVLYDDNKILGKVEGVEIVDAKIQDDTWKLYKLMPDRFNQALAETEKGIPQSVQSLDLKTLEQALPEQKPKPRPVIESGVDDDKAPMADADAVMSSILGGVKSDEAPDDPAENDEIDEETPTKSDEDPKSDGPKEPSETETEPGDLPEPEPAPPKPKAAKKKAAPKAKKPKMESHKLF